VKRPSGSLVAATILLLPSLLAAGSPTGAPAPEELSPAQIEEAASVARHAAEAALRGRSQLLFEAFDRPTLVARALGAPLATRLTDRQRDGLEHDLVSNISRDLTLKPDPLAVAKPIGAVGKGAEAWITLMLPVTPGDLKTDWIVRSRHGEWKIEDVVLTDAGRSLREEAVDSLGRPPLAVLRRQHADARRAAWPRLAGLAAVVLVAGIFARHLKGRDRSILFVAAAAPALLFCLDAVLAVARVLREPVELRLSGSTQVESILRKFHRALSRRDTSQARRALGEAVAAGVRPQPLHFVLGRAYEALRESQRAAEEYGQALKPPHPAPGAWVGLARLALAEGKSDEAIVDLDRYLEMTTPDAQSLYLKAIALAKKHDLGEAQEALTRAESLAPDEPVLYDLSARLSAAAGDATRTIDRLREEERLRPLDRATIAGDPDFAPLRDDPDWQAFLEEKKSPPSGRARS
jgi:tetratricopeptide (TPR) repeat protein